MNEFFNSSKYYFMVDGKQILGKDLTSEQILQAIDEQIQGADSLFLEAFENLKFLEKEEFDRILVAFPNELVQMLREVVEAAHNNETLEDFVSNVSETTTLNLLDLTPDFFGLYFQLTNENFWRDMGVLLFPLMWLNVKRYTEENL